MTRGCVLLITLLPLVNPVSALPSQTPAEVPAMTIVTGSATTDFATTRSGAPTLQLKALLSFTGITPHLADIQLMVQEARARHIIRCDAEAAFSHSTQSYSPNTIHDQLIDTLWETISPDNLTAVLRWYGSDTGKRVISSEQRSRPIESFDTTLTQIKQKPDWIKRKLLIEEIERHTHANRLGAIAGIETEHGGLMLSGCVETYGKLLAETGNPDDEEPANRSNVALVMAQIIRAEISQFEKYSYQETLDGMTFSLQDLNQSDLQEYAEFVAGPAARHVFETLVSAMEQTLQNAPGAFIEHTQ